MVPNSGNLVVLNWEIAHAIACNDSQNQYRGIFACGWICECYGELCSAADEPAFDLTKNECGVLLENVKHIEDFWLKEEDAMNEAAVEAAYSHVSELYQLLYADDENMAVQ